MLPVSIRQSIEAYIGQSIQQMRSVSGGSINQAFQLSTPQKDYFLKWNRNPLPGMFPAEEKGLSILHQHANADMLAIPEVLAVHDGDDTTPSYLLLEWLAADTKNPQTMKQLGAGLAQLHAITATAHGLDHDNYIGSLPQKNKQHNSWSVFYAQQRIGVQMEIAAERGRLTSHRRQKLEKLISEMDKFLPREVPASLLHGDLWSGNVLVTTGSRPAILDPAVYYGHAEVELAFTELFGGFSSSFYDAYWSTTAAKQEGYAERRDLYQLYPLLVHLNIFGGGYARSVDAILHHYVS